MEAMQAAEFEANLFDDLLGQAIKLMSRDTVEIAYHLLAASLECARIMGSIPRLRTIEQLANEWQTQLDAQDPLHRLSTELASRRRTAALFSSLARTARAAQIVIETKTTLREMRRGEPLEGNTTQTGLQSAGT